MAIGPDDPTPTVKPTAHADTVMTAATQRLQVETLTRAHDAGKLAGVLECRETCEVIKAKRQNLLLRGCGLALLIVLSGFLLYLATRFGIGVDPWPLLCPPP